MKSLERIVQDERERAVKRKNKVAENQVPEHVREAMSEIIKYLWSDELKHFNEHGAEGRLQGKIFPQLILVRTWLEEIEN